jgi:site-specific DNA-methyltransferase (adenine-specific)/adenine-specific DNA-methyltransferase
MPRIKKFLASSRLVVPRSIWSHTEAGHNQEAKLEILSLFPESPFSTPKPTRLVKKIIEIASNPGDLVLDSFSGSGTTGHAVLQLNKRGIENRHFILIEMDSKIAHEITAERLRRVIQGYDWKDQKGASHHEEGLGGSFRYCELGPTLFDTTGQIRPEVSFHDLARHVFFTETGQPLPADVDESSPLLGAAEGRAVYLLYNGVLRDAGNTLTPALLESLPAFDGPKVIYADGSLVGRERLRSLNAAFKQIPYEIRTR